MYGEVSADAIQQAVRQIKRWLYAAEHDADVKIRLLHSEYAAGDIDMLRQMTTDESVLSATGESMLALWRRATAAADKAEKEVLKRCKL